MSDGRYVAWIGGERKEVGLVQRGRAWEITVDGETHIVEQSVIEKDQRFSMMIGDRSFLVDLVEKDWKEGRFVVNAIAEQIEVRVRDELEAVADSIAPVQSASGGHDLKAPMPGIVVRSLVAVGDRVLRGQGLLILEAMKMQNELASDADGVVTEILVAEGQMVETGALLLRVSEEGE